MRRFIRLAGMLLAGLLLAQPAAAQQVQLVIDQTLSACLPSTTNTHLCTFDVLAGTNGPPHTGQTEDVYLFAKGKVLAASTSATSYLKPTCKIFAVPTPAQDLTGNWKKLVAAMELLKVAHLSVFRCDRKGTKTLPLDGPKTLHFEYKMEVDNSMLKNKNLRTCAAILGADYATVGAPYSCADVDVTPPKPSYDVEVENPASNLLGSGFGAMEWHYRLRNDGDVPIPAGTRLNLRVEVPGRIKVYYVDSMVNGKYSAGPWTCEKMEVWPNSLKHQDGTYWKLRSPLNLVCSYVTTAAIAPKGVSDMLRLYTDGGYPREMCAFGSSFSPVSSVFKKNLDPDAAQVCYNFVPPPGATFDLSLEGIGGGTPVGDSLFLPWIKNVGGAALEPGSGVAGFTYEADIPAGARLTNLQVHLGWRCENPDPAGEPKILLPDPSDGTGHPKERLLNFPGPFKLKCRYTTPHEFGAEANVRRDFWSYPVSYFVKDWPKGKKACARIAALPKGTVESNTSNNERCVQ